MKLSNQEMVFYLLLSEVLDFFVTFPNLDPLPPTNIKT